MECSVEHVHRGGEVQRSAELRRDPQRFGDRRGTVIADDHVERLGGHEVEREERRVVGQAGRQRGGDAHVRQVGSDQPIERSNEPMGVFGRKVEPELLHRDQTTGVGLIGAKDGAENAGADLMENPKWSEGVRWRGAGSVRVQRGYSSRDGDGS